MGLRKGMRSNNPAGRIPGIPNHSTAATKKILDTIIRRNFSAKRVQADLLTLEPKERLELLVKLLQFQLPRPVENLFKLNRPGEDDPREIIIEVIDSRLQVDHSLLN